MKLKMGLLFTVLLVGLFVACVPIDDETIGNDEKATFTGTIVEISEQNALVNIDEGEILSSGNRVYVELSINNEAIFEVGDKIRVEYDGIIRESFPLGINVTNLELLD